MYEIIGFLGFFSRMRLSSAYISCDAEAPPPGELILMMMALTESSSSYRFTCLMKALESRITPSRSTIPILSPNAVNSLLDSFLTARYTSVKTASTNMKNAPPPMTTHNHVRDFFSSSIRMQAPQWIDVSLAEKTWDCLMQTPITGELLTQR